MEKYNGREQIIAISSKHGELQCSSKSISTECTDASCSSKCIGLNKENRSCEKQHSSLKTINCIKHIPVVNGKYATSIKDIGGILPITGIDEVLMNEEDSPVKTKSQSHIKMNSYWSNSTNTEYVKSDNIIKYGSCALPTIQEGPPSLLSKNEICEKRISSFLDKLNIKQVFPSEINIVKLSICIKKSKPLAPQLCMGNSSLFLKRQSTKYIPMSKLI